MNAPKSLARYLTRGLAIVALGGAVFGSVAIATAADHATQEAKTVLPVKATCSKQDQPKTEGPYVVTLENTGKHELKVHVRVDLDVTAHNRPKSRDEEHNIAAGKSVRIEDLAAGDKLTVTAKGYEPQKVVVK